MRQHSLLFLLSLYLASSLSAQESLLQSGPMVGYSTMREVAIWVQTTQEAIVHIEYQNISDTSITHKTDPIRTEKSKAYSGLLIAVTEPGIEYEYSLFINGKFVSRPYTLHFQSQPLWKWRTDAPDFSFAIGSCMYANEPVYDRPVPYGLSNKIFNSIYKDHPDFMLWLGDNIYLRESDWNSRTGILHRYTHMRSTKEIHPLLGSIHHYAIWDDHDFGPDNSDRSFWASEATREAFKMFWANPNYDVAGNNDLNGTFFWNDCQFFMMDNRSHRMPKGEEDAVILGDDQKTWLIEALRYSTSKFKFICIGGQFLNDAAVKENHACFAKERKEIIDLIDKYNIKGVVFLTGDRHFSEVSKLKTENGITIYDITCSPLTATPSSYPNEKNNLRIPGSQIDKNNYAVLKVSGPQSDRTLTVTFKDVKGDCILKDFKISCQ